jgi:dTMP kinase
MNKFIVIEGGDGAGKGTQAKLLVDRLGKETKVTFFDFPQYEKTLAGKLVGRYLKGEFGDPLLLSPYIASLPYALDGVAARDEPYKALEEGVVICNRYIPSNIGHQASKLPEDKRSEFISWLERMEYGELKLPKPTLVIYLYVPVEISSSLVEKKEARAYIGGENAKGAKDGHEKDENYQQKVIDVYTKMSKERNDWKLIDCVEDGRLLSIEEIHDKIMRIVKS